jgi:hypothetical protein
LGPSSTFWTIPKGFPLGRTFTLLHVKQRSIAEKSLRVNCLARKNQLACGADGLPRSSYKKHSCLRLSSGSFKVL